MNSVVYHVASGQAFFTGCLLIAAALGLTLLRESRPTMFGRTILTLLGAALIAVSGTPLVSSLAWLSGLVVAFWLIVDRPAWGWNLHVKYTARGMLGGWLIALVSAEIPHHLVPRVPFGEGATLFVIGDSVSAGMGVGEHTWARRLTDSHGVTVRDFSRVGATAESAMAQAEQVEGPGLVLVEIGGNDVLGPGGGTPVEQFEQHLHELLKRLKRQNRTVAMLEIPLPPFANGYGRAQRSLAHNHGVILIPKRVLLGVLTTDGATVDTIHLTESGHALMADAIWELVKQPSP